MLGNTSNPGGLRFHEWKIQMGLPQGDLLALQESFQPLRARTLDDNKQIFKNRE
jgi:hypothetical protein